MNPFSIFDVGDDDSYGTPPWEFFILESRKHGELAFVAFF